MYIDRVNTSWSLHNGKYLHWSQHLAWKSDWKWVRVYVPYFLQYVLQFLYSKLFFFDRIHKRYPYIHIFSSRFLGKKPPWWTLIVNIAGNITAKKIMSLLIVTQVHPHLGCKIKNRYYKSPLSQYLLLSLASFTLFLVSTRRHLYFFQSKKVMMFIFLQRVIAGEWRSKVRDEFLPS